MFRQGLRTVFPEAFLFLEILGVDIVAAVNNKQRNTTMKVLYKGKPCKMSFWDLVNAIDLDSMPAPKQCKLNEKLPPRRKSKKLSKDG